MSLTNTWISTYLGKSQLPACFFWGSNQTLGFGFQTEECTDNKKLNPLHRRCEEGLWSGSRSKSNDRTKATTTTKKKIVEYLFVFFFFKKACHESTVHKNGWEWDLDNELWWFLKVINMYFTRTGLKTTWILLRTIYTHNTRAVDFMQRLFLSGWIRVASLYWYWLLRGNTERAFFWTKESAMKSGMKTRRRKREKSCKCQ